MSISSQYQRYKKFYILLSMKEKDIERKDIPPPILTEEEEEELIELLNLFIDDSNDCLTMGEAREKAFAFLSKEEIIALLEKLKEDED